MVPFLSDPPPILFVPLIQFLLFLAVRSDSHMITCKYLIRQRILLYVAIAVSPPRVHAFLVRNLQLPLIHEMSTLRVFILAQHLIG